MSRIYGSREVMENRGRGRLMAVAGFMCLLAWAQVSSPPPPTEIDPKYGVRRP